METLRRYYTDVLSGTPSYSSAQKKAILFRKHHAASLSLFSLTPPQIKTVLLAPLLYSFPDEMGTDTEVRQAARNLIFSVLTGDENIQERMVEFLNLFEHFARREERICVMGCLPIAMNYPVLNPRKPKYFLKKSKTGSPSWVGNPTIWNLNRRGSNSPPIVCYRPWIVRFGTFSAKH